MIPEAGGRAQAPTGQAAELKPTTWPRQGRLHDIRQSSSRLHDIRQSSSRLHELKHLASGRNRTGQAAALDDDPRGQAALH